MDGRVVCIDGIYVLERMRCWTLIEDDGVALSPFESDHRWKTYRERDWWKPRQATISRTLSTRHSRSQKYEQVHKDEINRRRRERRKVERRIIAST